MLSLAECRKHLRQQEHYTDSQVEKIRQQLYQLAEVSVSAFRNVGAKNNLETVGVAAPDVSESSFDYEFEERAAIHEFDGKATTARSERLAKQDKKRGRL